MERTFNRGEYSRTVSSPVEAVRLIAAGWRETTAQSAEPTNESGEQIAAPADIEITENSATPDDAPSSDAGSSPDEA